jgi:hypothetical protein
MQSSAESKAVRIKFNPALTETGDHPLAVAAIAVASATVSVEFSVFSIEFHARLVGFKWNSVQSSPR